MPNGKAGLGIRQSRFVIRNSTLPTFAHISDKTVESRLAKILEHGDRVMRVVVDKTVVPERVVSVYFDRTIKGELENRRKLK
jgi:hypothetical protein